MRPIIITLLITSSLSCLYACAGNNPPSSSVGSPSANVHDHQFIKKLDKLQQKDPVISARKALSGGTPYFLCNAGRSRTVPGLSPEIHAQGSANCSTRCLEGVTDAVSGPNHARYLQAALDFSAKWNQVMIEACR